MIRHNFGEYSAEGNWGYKTVDAEGWGSGAEELSPPNPPTPPAVQHSGSDTTFSAQRKNVLSLGHARLLLWF
ncbi:hypothetical protein JTB14_009062 [Gonioctena quinquepunctata]|nr:hypothetical protein JTB14_009062 [Gonioctena quinquepunctata]